MELKKELQLIRAVILDEIHHVKFISTQYKNSEDYIKKLTSLLRKISKDYLSNLTPQERIDIVSLINNTLIYINTNISEGDLSDEDIFILESMEEDYTALLKKFMS